jgi:hypothetical protein
MARSSLTYIPNFSVKFFFQPIYTDHPARFGLIWFSGFRGEDLNVIFNQNMPNLHNRYISAERKISQKNPEYMLNYSLPCSCSKGLSKDCSFCPDLSTNMAATGNSCF